MESSPLENGSNVHFCCSGFVGSLQSLKLATPNINSGGKGQTSLEFSSGNQEIAKSIRRREALKFIIILLLLPSLLVVEIDKGKICGRSDMYAYSNNHFLVLISKSGYLLYHSDLKLFTKKSCWWHYLPT